jgi:hypothetical protein
MTDCNDSRDGWANWRNCDHSNPECCDFYEEDEPVEHIQDIVSRGLDGLTIAPTRFVSADGLCTLSFAGFRPVGRPIFAGQPMLPVA